MASELELEVGKIYHNMKVTDADSNIHIVSLQVMRKADFTEYRECFIEHQGDGAFYKDAPFYYEVSID